MTLCPRTRRLLPRIFRSPTRYTNIGYNSPPSSLHQVPDPNGSKGWNLNKPLSPSMKDDYWARYSAARIVSHVCSSINEKPRKIKYQTVVDWCLMSSPVADTMAFLGWVFDEGELECNGGWVE